MSTYTCECGRFCFALSQPTITCEDCGSSVDQTVQERITRLRNVNRAMLIDLVDAIRACLPFVPHLSSANRDALDTLERAEEVVGPSCPSCSSYEVETEMKEQTFLCGPNSVPLTVTVPVLKCENCRMEFTDHRGEAIRTAAVKKHLEKP